MGFGSCPPGGSNLASPWLESSSSASTAIGVGGIAIRTAIDSADTEARTREEKRTGMRRFDDPIWLDESKERFYARRLSIFFRITP